MTTGVDAKIHSAEKKYTVNGNGNAQYKQKPEQDATGWTD